MEPISAAIVAALAKLAEPAIKDAYGAFKGFLVRKFGREHDVVRAMDSLHDHPGSGGRAATLDEELVKSNALADPAILKAAQTLIASVTSETEGPHIIQTVHGDYNVVGGRDVNVSGGSGKRGG